MMKIVFYFTNQHVNFLSIKIALVVQRVMLRLFFITLAKTTKPIKESYVIEKQILKCYINEKYSIKDK